MLWRYKLGQLSRVRLRVILTSHNFLLFTKAVDVRGGVRETVTLFVFTRRKFDV